MTNAVEYLDQVDRIVVFNEGKIAEQGQYKELYEANGILASFIHALTVNREQTEKQKEKENSERESRASEVAVKNMNEEIAGNN